MIEARQPSSLLGGGILVTGEIERTTDFEQGLPVHEAFRDGQWQLDPLLHDDQALVAHVRGKGLVVITGCGHAGVVNTVRYARKITGVDRGYALLSGFHLAGLLYEPIIPPTVEALREIRPEVNQPRRQGAPAATTTSTVGISGLDSVRLQINESAVRSTTYAHIAGSLHPQIPSESPSSELSGQSPRAAHARLK